MTRSVSLHAPSPEQSRIHRVRETIHRDGATPGGALEGLAAIVEDETWRHVNGPDDKPFGSFRAFVEAKSPFGLGIDEPELRKIIDLRHPHEGVTRIHQRMETMRARVKRLLADGIEPANEHGGDRRSEGGKDQGNAATLNGRGVDYVVARLKRDDPALAEQVINGAMTANAAARKAGIRKPRIVVSTPERIAASLKRHLDPSAIARLRELLG